MPEGPSIYRFFRFLVENRDEVRRRIIRGESLEEMEFGDDFRSGQRKGAFPDLIIRINIEDDELTGGELVEFKGSQSYSTSSFNSTIPTGRKNIGDIAGMNTDIWKQMEEAGNNVAELPERYVYYLVTGKNEGRVKVVLVHGSFFETIPVGDLIREAFLQIMGESDPGLTEAEMDRIARMHIQQEMFSRVRRIPGASVTIRFRIMTEADGDANLLDSNAYPEIGDDTVNMCVAYQDDQEREAITEWVRDEIDVEFEQIDVDHRMSGGRYVVFRVPL